MTPPGAVIFAIFYVMLPTASLYWSVGDYVRDHAGRDDLPGPDWLFFLAMVALCLYVAGAEHFFKVNRRLGSVGISMNALVRLLTWDAPCALWGYLSVWAWETFLRGADTSFLLMTFVMLITFIPIAIVVILATAAAFRVCEARSQSSE